MIYADRPSWDDLFFGFARQLAERSLCTRSAVGAVIVTPDNRIAGYGYNGAPAEIETMDGRCNTWCPRGMGLSHKPGYSDCFAIHAEANALLHADREETIGATLYVTRFPCFPCAKQVVGAGVVRAVFGEDDGGVFHRPAEVADFLEMCGVVVVRYG